MLTEDGIVNWVKSQGGVLHTRKYSNLGQFDQYVNRKNLFVCLTGYNNIVKYFFANILPRFKHPVVLITLETDGFTMQDNYLKSDLLKHWFTWNKPCAHPKLSALPIALNYDRHVPILSAFLSKKKEYNPTKLLLANFDVKTNPIRYTLLRKALADWKAFAVTNPYLKEDKFYVTNSIIDKRLGVKVTNSGYYDMINDYKFILSPPGAGEDCHRTWEALYVGCIPIVRSSAINELYEGLPVLVIDSWEDISEEFLNQKWEEMLERKYDMSKLTPEYWFARFIAVLAIC
jgi:hypothetical protein